MMTAEVIANSPKIEVDSVVQPVLLDDFFKSIQKPAYRMAQLSTHNSPDALDIVQDSMMKLYEKYRGKPVAELKPLFYAILNSKITDWHRKRQFRSKFHWFFSDQDEAGDIIENLAEDLAMDVDQLLEHERDLVELYRALSELSERQRQVLLLRHWQGFSVQETADILNCSSGSIKTHLHRAINTLKQMNIDISMEELS